MLESELDLVWSWSQKLPAIPCRLGFWLISNNLCDFVHSTDIIAAIRTDHTVSTKMTTGTLTNNALRKKTLIKKTL